MKVFGTFFILLALAGIFFEKQSLAVEISVGFSEDALTLDPANHRRRATETILRNIYDGLFTRTSRMEVATELAESWRQIDALTYEFKLHEGVKFHNGETLSVEDIRFTFNRLTRQSAMEGETSPRKSLLPDIEKIEIVDNNTIRFILRSAWPQFPSMLPFQEVVNRDFVEANRSSGLKTVANGTGPFKLLEWRPGEEIVMQRFEDYYGGSKAIPPVDRACVDRISFRIMPNNQTRVAALLDGSVDIIDKLPAESIDKVITSEIANVIKTPGTRTYFIALNLSLPPFDDIKFRKALNHAIDKKQLIEEHLKGGAVVVGGVLSPYAFGANPDLPEYGHDLAKTHELLAQTQYDATRTLVLETDESLLALANSIADMLTKAGIDTVVKTDLNGEIKRRWQPFTANTGDMWINSWGNGSLDPVGIFYPTLRSAGRGNISGYSNSEVDALLDAASQEIDQLRRASLYREAEKIVNREAPWIFLWVPEDLYGVSKRIKNWRPSPDGRINLHDVCKI